MLTAANEYAGGATQGDAATLVFLDKLGGRLEDVTEVLARLPAQAQDTISRFAAG